MRTIGFVALLATLFISLFRIAGAKLDNNVLAIALMILLVILFSDLKEFNFWGLSGKKKEEEKIKELSGKKGVTSKKPPKVTSQQAQQVREETTVELEGEGKGTFLTLSFEIERLLQIMAKLIFKNEKISMENIGILLKEKGMLTDDGVEQLNSIRWLKEVILNEKEDDVAESTLIAGSQLAYNFYRDLKKWLDNIR